MIRLVLVVFLSCVSAPAAAAPPVVLVVGDSLSAAYGVARSEGWVALLADRLGDGCRVVNASISGDTTSSGAARLPRALRAHAPAVVIIGLGGNDGLRGYPVTELHTNLATMLDQVQAAGARSVLIGVSLPPNYGPEYRRGFDAVYAALAAQYDVPLVRFAIEDVADRPGMLQDDGIHPTAAAQPWMLDLVWPALQPLLKCTV